MTRHWRNIMRTMIADLDPSRAGSVLLRGWIRRIRETKSTTFIMLSDCSGTIQVVAEPSMTRSLALRTDSAVAVTGRPRREERAPGGLEVDCDVLEVLGAAQETLPFTSVSRLEQISPELAINYRPLALRTERGGAIFRVEAALAEEFRAAMRRRRFTEIFTPKIVASATEGGSNLFEIRYFDRAAYLAQSPQFYKEHGVAGLERVFETGHVYRAEPHATSRHLTEYYSLDLEFGFINGPEDVIQLEKELLTWIFQELNRQHWDVLKGYRATPLPSMLDVPVWEFHDCLDMLSREHGTSHLQDDLDPQAERQLCALAEAATGVPAVFVLGFPASSRPFYSAPRGEAGAAQRFALLFEGLEIT